MKSSPNKQASAHIELILELYTLIPSSYKITLGELHQKLLQRGIHRSTRTIQRSLDIITHYFDVEKDERSKPYGYRKNETNQVRLRAKEAIMLHLVDKHLKPLLPKEVAIAFHQAFGDAEHYIQKLSAEHKELQWLSKVHFVEGKLPSPSTLSSEAFITINEALYHQRQVRLKTSNHTPSLTVRPIGLLLGEHECQVLIRPQPNNEIQQINLDDITQAQGSTFSCDEEPLAFKNWLDSNPQL